MKIPSHEVKYWHAIATPIVAAGSAWRHWLGELTPDAQIARQQSR